MGPDEPSLPEGWTQADDPEHSPGKYDPRQYIVYERTDLDVGVQIHPSEPNTSTRPQNRWRVIVSQGTTQDSMTVLDESRATIQRARSPVSLWKRTTIVPSVDPTTWTT